MSAVKRRDRVTRLGRGGTVIDVHLGKVHLSVLPDDVSPSQLERWRRDEIDPEVAP
ncbi:hypothetical protein [Nocardioides sp. InS609-2]|uniref:hypothetical protein n=1 Tax=Nocardioides sp. InS609-2 TaxID=2760705 RepID=UPI0020BE54AF|nr:hypothetical protein [Nocardioides sp. InS609-2]